MPEVVDFLAVKAVIQDHDCCHKNYYFYRDTLGTAEWQALPWDVDLSFGHVWNSTNSYWNDQIITANGQSSGGVGLFLGNNNVIFAQMFNTPAIRQMYLRRVRTLLNQMLGASPAPAVAAFYEQRVAGHVAELRADVALDVAKWGTWLHSAGGAQASIGTAGIEVFDTNIVT